VNKGLITAVNDIFQHSPEKIMHYIKTEDETGKTLIFYAAYYNYQNLVLYLLGKGADPLKVDDNGVSIFHICAYRGYQEVINLVLNYQRHTLRRKYFQVIKDLKKQFKIKKSDVNKGVLVSPDAHLDHVKNNFRNFMDAINEAFDNYLEEVKS
jgi:ankyrin repeat protein